MSASDFQQAKVRDYFNCRDTNGNGQLDWDDFKGAAERLAEACGWKPSDLRYRILLGHQEVMWSRMLLHMDGSRNGKITLEECVDFFAALAKDVSASGKLPDYAQGHAQAMLRALDIDGNGVISPIEYSAYLRSLGSDANAAETFGKLDLNGDGVISFEELETLYKQWVVSDDPSEPGNLLVTGRLPG